MLSLEEIKTKTAEELQQLLLEKDKVVEQHIKENARLRHHLNMLLQQRFGKQSDKLDNPHQGYLFDEDRLPATEEVTPSEEDNAFITVDKHQRKRGRKPLPKELPRIQRVHDLSDEEKQCACGCQLTQIGDEKTEQLEFIPAQVRVIEHVQLKYACKTCEETIRLASKPKQPIPKSIATPGLLSHVLVSKFCDHLPFYRQENILQRMGIDIARASLCNWTLKCADLLTPLINIMQREMCAYDIGYADETTVQVLKETERPASSKSYMWLFAGGPPEKRSFIYQYDPSRSHAVAEAFWSGFKGYLHTDGYQGYQTLFAKSDINGVHCWAHARRKFVDIIKVTKKATLAQWAVKHIAKLYALEKQMKQGVYITDQIASFRQKKGKPLLEQFKRWCDEHLTTVPPESPIGKAIKYCLKYWDNLMRYIEDGRLDIDNNLSERAIKPFVMGRKAWLFHDNPKGAKAGAVIYSLIETCKAHKIEPYAYLKYVLTKIVDCESDEDYEKLLPFNVCPELLLKAWRVVD